MVENSFILNFILYITDKVYFYWTNCFIKKKIIFWIYFSIYKNTSFIFINPLYFDYVLIFISVILIFIIGFLLVIISWLITPSLFDIEKLSIYECGFDPFETSRINVDINFFIIGLLFLVFDLELFFLIPFLTIFFKWNFLNYYLIFYFLIILLMGFIYEIKSYSLFYIKNNIQLKKLYKLFF